MTFIQWEFLVFFSVLFTLYWGVRDRVKQNVLLESKLKLLNVRLQKQSVLLESKQNELLESKP